jgi:penicillin-binding protein 1C
MSPPNLNRSNRPTRQSTARAASPDVTRRRRRFFKRFTIPQWLELFVLGLFALALFVLGGIIVWASLVPIPSINDFENRQVAQSTKIYDRTGNVVLYDAHGAEERTSVPLTAISTYIQEATVSIEDSTFYTNAGVRPLSTLRALWVDLTAHSYQQGGSTITQQVVKNALLNDDKKITRKIEEAILALRLTKTYSKDQILNTYLNESPYGGTIYGVQAATQYFFGVDASNVDLAQAAYIAALPQAPTYFSPYGNNKSALDNRKNLVLARMKSQGYITTDEYNQAIAENVQFKTESMGGVLAPHFVFYILSYLEQKYGVDAVDNGGLKVTTTLDYDLQQQAQNIVTSDGPGLLKNFNASNTGVVAIDPKTGQIVAMVGSEDYFNNAIDGQVNVTTSNRQPGSSFKPFIYATAFEKGYTPQTILFDLQTQFSTTCSPSDVTNNTPPCYAPVNYSGEFMGPMSLSKALGNSENVPSVKLLYLSGIQNSINTAQSMGITTLGNPSQYGLTLVLGGGEVNLLQMTGAYAVFANDGVKNPPTGILDVRDSKGNILENYQNQATRVLDPQIAREMNDILSNDANRQPEFTPGSLLTFSGYDVADKTGTTNNSRDAWIIGYSPSIVVGEWAGNNNNTPMIKNIAALIVVPTWHKIMAAALEKYSSTADDFTAPAPNPNEDTLPPVLKGSWNSDPSQGIHEILHWVQKDNPLAGPPTNPWSDSQYAYWEYPVQVWAANNGEGASTTPPTSDGTVPGNPVSAGFQITAPQSGQIISSASTFTITASDGNPSNITGVTYFLNGATLGSSITPPYSISFLPASRGPATLQAVARHTDGTNEVTTTNFTIQ